MRINIRIILLFLFALTCPTLRAQSNSGELPSWFFKSENYNRINMAVGISKPNSDTTRAIEQAKFNALLNYSILHDARFTSLTNVGVANQSDEKMQSVAIEYILYTSIIKGSLPSLAVLKTQEKHFTTYSEALILFEIDNNYNADTNAFQYTVIRRAGFQKENSNFPFFVEELDVEVKLEDSVVYSFCLIKDRINLFECQQNTLKLFFEEDIPFRKMHKYPENLTPKSGKTIFLSMPVPLHNGLWKAFIFNLVDQVSIYNSMDINLQFKLSTANLGNKNTNNQNLSFQQMVYSLKNIQSRSLNSQIANIEVSDNNLLFAVSQNSIKESESFNIQKPGRSEKKLLKKLKNENWLFLGEEQIDNAWLNAWHLSGEQKYLSAEIEIQSNSLQSGIIEGLQLAKLQLSSLLATKIVSLSNSELSKNQTAIKSAKLINIEKTGSIGPYFIFYQKHGFNLFNIKMIILYDLGQTH